VPRRWRTPSRGRTGTPRPRPAVAAAPHGGGLGARAHQHRDVGRAQARKGASACAKPVVHRPATARSGGAARGKAFAVLGDPRQFQVVVDVQRRHGSVGSLEPLGPPASLHGHKGQGVSPPSGSRSRNAPSPPRASARANRWLTAHTSACVER
jgi:hypothetical protein